MPFKIAVFQCVAAFGIFEYYFYNNQYFMQNTIAVMQCMHLFGILFISSVVKEAQSLSVNATCDNVITLYLDGVKKTTQNNRAWDKVDIKDIPDNTAVLGIYCENFGGPGGILAAISDGRVTGAKEWKCTNTYQAGWASNGYDDSHWLTPVSFGKQEEKVWKVLPAINASAEWIWTRGPYFNSNDTDVWCRTRIRFAPPIIFSNMILQKAKQTGNMAPCGLYNFIQATGDSACRQLCEGNAKCVYFMYKQTCGSNIGCILCLNGTSNTTGGVKLSDNVVNQQDFVSVKMGACENHDICPIVKDCSELRSVGVVTSGSYPITLNNGKKLDVYCDMETAGGGWTVFQRRIDDETSFNQTYVTYKEGFGHVTGSFWLGNAHIADLTKQDGYQMRVDLRDLDNTMVYALYKNFKVYSNEFYKMNFTDYIKGSAGNSLLMSMNMKFSTWDRDQDNSGEHCAQRNKGAWWYNACLDSNLNSIYQPGLLASNKKNIGIIWEHFRGKYYSLSFSEIKLRPIGYKPTVSLYPFQYGSLPPRDCAGYRDMGFKQSGVYPITTRGTSSDKLDVYCDMETSGSGWLVIQRRIDGAVDFYRDYSSYQKGFGQLEKEFWLGNDFIASITEQGSYELRVDMEDDNTTKYAFYGSFSINRMDSYKLWVRDYTGTAGDSLTYQHGQKWSTYDVDNDSANASCAHKYHGAWWYGSCHRCNLNGLYGSTTYGAGINWKTWKGYTYSLKATEMKIRPAGYKLI